MTASIQLFLTEETATLRAEGTSILSAPHTILLMNSHLRSKNIYNGVMRPSNNSPSGIKYDIAFKLAYDREGIRRLKFEHEIYTKDLQALQGGIVPICYGFFTGKIGGVPTACLVLELCASGHSNPTVGKDEFYRKLMLGICKIHQAGIVHNALENRSHLMRHGKEPRIVDFSQARRHYCPGAYPADRYGDLQGSPDVPWCMELAKLEGLYGMMSGNPPDQREWLSLVPSALNSVTHLLSNFSFSG